MPRFDRLIALTLACLVVSPACGDITNPSIEQTQGDDELNNSMAKASFIAPNATITGSVGTLFDAVDWFRTRVPTAGTLAVRVSNTAATAVEYGLGIVMADSQQVVGGSGTLSGSGAVVGTVAVSAGEVWIKLGSGGFGSSSPGLSYQLTPVFIPTTVADVGEPNGSGSTATPLTDAVTATVGFSGDSVDWYLIEPNVTGFVTVTLTNLHPATSPPILNGDVEAIIYDRDLHPQVAQFAGPSEAKTLSPAPDGVTPRFYVRVRSLNGVGPGGAAYRLKVDRR